MHELDTATVSNPYDANQELAEEITGQSLRDGIGTLVWCFPMIQVGSIYGTWLIAAVLLGRLPVPMQDDPKGLAIDVPCFMTGCLMILSPGAAVFGFLHELSAPESSWSRRIGRAFLLLSFWGATISFHRWDPLRVVEWFID